MSKEKNEEEQESDGKEEMYEEVIEKNRAIPETPSQTKLLYDLIKTLDKGNGAPYEEVLEKANAPQTEKIITMLLQEGDIFEIQPGRLKVLN